MCERLIRKTGEGKGERSVCFYIRVYLDGEGKGERNISFYINVYLDLVKFENEHCFYLDVVYAFFILNQLSVVLLCCFMGLTCLLH